MPHVNGILETALYVDSVNRSVEFYETIFNFDVMGADERFAVLNIKKGQVLLLFKKGGSTKPTKIPGGIIPPSDGKGEWHLAFSVTKSELDEWEKWLLENNIQIGEYKGQIGTKEFGHLLVGIATEYNNALLVIENANIGWSTVQTVIDRDYNNLYYSPKLGEIRADSYFDQYMDTSKMVAGFTMTSKVRPMIISKFQEYLGDQGVVIQSKRLIEEMKVFIWKNGRPEAQHGYNDDLIMPLAIGTYLRDTALKFQQQSLDMTRAALGGIKTNKVTYSGGYNASKHVQNPYGTNEFYINGKKEDIDWLLDK